MYIHSETKKSLLKPDEFISIEILCLDSKPDRFIILQVYILLHSFDDLCNTIFVIKFFAFKMKLQNFAKNGILEEKWSDMLMVWSMVSRVASDCL